MLCGDNAITCETVESQLFLGMGRTKKHQKTYAPYFRFQLRKKTRHLCFECQLAFDLHLSLADENEYTQTLEETQALLHSRKNKQLGRPSPVVTILPW